MILRSADRQVPGQMRNRQDPAKPRVERGSALTVGESEYGFRNFAIGHGSPMDIAQVR